MKRASARPVDLEDLAALTERGAEGERHRVEAALAGVLPVEHLSDEKGIVFDSEVQSRLDTRLRTTNLGAVLAARGVTTVALNEHGELTEYRPDGTSASV
jgi:hypothetical protein